MIVGTGIGSSVDGVGIGVLNALASGTFSYMGVVGITAKEVKAGKECLPAKLGAVALGFTSMALLAVWV